MRCASESDDNNRRSSIMYDLIYLALGAAVLLALGLYARALGRL